MIFWLFSTAFLLGLGVLTGPAPAFFPPFLAPETGGEPLPDEEPLKAEEDDDDELDFDEYEDELNEEEFDEDEDEEEEEDDDDDESLLDEDNDLFLESIKLAFLSGAL